MNWIFLPHKYFQYFNLPLTSREMETTERALTQQIEMIKQLNEVNLENNKRNLDKISDKLDRFCDKVDENTAKINQMHTASVPSGEVLLFMLTSTLFN